VPGFEMSTVINRRVEDVFAVLADLVNDPKWRREWVDARATTEGSLGVGSRCVLIGKAMGQRTEAEYEITDYDLNRRVAWKTVRGPLPLTFFRAVSVTDGATRVTIGYDAEARGAMKLAGPLLAAMGKRALAGDFPRLKELLEAQP